jgi:serine protease DegQ
MARHPLYSRSPQRPAKPVAMIEGEPETGPAGPASPGTDPSVPSALGSRVAVRLAGHPAAGWRRHQRLLAGVALLALGTAAGWPVWTARPAPPLTIAQIDAALRESIAKQPLASAGVAAYEAILPSVVQVVAVPAADTSPPAGGRRAAANPTARTQRPAGATRPGPGDDATAPAPGPGDGRSVGSGVVIVDTGLILTSLHVVEGAGRIRVTFTDGTESEAHIVNRQPENDLAVLQAHTLPDDLQAATLRSTAGLSAGEAVMAVGFPFGIGPSASVGVVSGLKREFRTPDGQRSLSNLIQFDAAANPGNSGGPLVTMDGHVVGIVAAIMNPTRQRTFIGIGFAVPIENAAAAVGMPPF